MMNFFESFELVERLCGEHFTADEAGEILRRSMPAIAWRPVEDESESWLYGSTAMLEPGSGWPTVDGRTLQHSARFKLDGLPKVLSDQPETGYLSFFDGYPWIGPRGLDVSRLGQVRYDDGRSVEEVACPPIPAELTQPDQAVFVVAEGPYWTIPPVDEIHDIVSAHEDEDSSERIDRFIEEMELSIVQDHNFYGQLFGRPTPLQYEITPEPRLDPQQYLSAGMSGWTHLASVRQESGVFDYYYAIELRDLRNRNFEQLIFTTQC